MPQGNSQECHMVASVLRAFSECCAVGVVKEALSQTWVQPELSHGKSRTGHAFDEDAVCAHHGSMRKQRIDDLLMKPESRVASALPECARDATWCFGL